MMSQRDRAGRKVRLLSPFPLIFVILFTSMALAQKGTSHPIAKPSNVALQTVKLLPMLASQSLRPTQEPSSLASETTGNPFLLPPVIYDSGGHSAASFAVADVNADGKTDLAIANFCGFRGCLIGVLLGRGDGTFLPVQTYAPGGELPTSIAIAM